MRMLVLAPLATARIVQPIVRVAAAARALGHEVQVVTRANTRVQTINGMVLSRNQAGVDLLRQALGPGRVMLLQPHLGRSPDESETALRDTERRRVLNWLELYCPDIVIMGEHEGVADDPCGAASITRLPNTTANTWYLRHAESGKDWHLSDREGATALRMGDGPQALQQSLSARLAKIDAGQSVRALNAVVTRHVERIAALRRPTAPLTAPSAKAESPAESVALPTIRGALESLRDGDVVFGKTLWVKGWIDDSSGSAIREIEVSINESTHRIKAETVRGDVAALLNTPDILGFDARLPLHAEGPRLSVVLTAHHRDGSQQVWQRRTVWANDCIPERHQVPVILGHANIETSTSDSLNTTRGAWLHGEVRVAEHTVRRLAAFQRGRPVLELDSLTAGTAASGGRFRHALPTQTYDPSLPLDLWIGWNGQTLVHWLRCSPQTISEPIARRWALGGIEEGSVIRGDILQCSVGPLDADSSPVAFINGRSVALEQGPTDTQSHLALSIPVAQFGNDIQVRVECGNTHQTLQLWRHVNAPTPSAPSVVTVPHTSTLAPPAQTELTQRPTVLLIRRTPSPTDELYVTAPLIPLHERGELHLDVIDLDDASEPSLDVDRLLAPGTSVVISRYISDRWIAAITRHKARLGPVFYLMDDDVPAALDSKHLPEHYRQRMGKVACGEFQTMIRLCDQFIVTSPHLHERYASAKTALVEPSYLQPPPHLKHLDKHSEILITYQGTEGHKDDLAAIAPALRATHDGFRQVRLRIIIGNARAVPEELRNLQRCEIVKPMSWADYKKFRARERAHIAIAPLLDTPYNRGKSIVKLFDIAALGAVGIYTKSPPYENVIEHGVNGLLLDNDPLLWRKALKWMIDHPNELQRMAHACQALAASRGDLARLQAHWRRSLGGSVSHV